MGAIIPAMRGDFEDPGNGELGSSLFFAQQSEAWGVYSAPPSTRRGCPIIRKQARFLCRVTGPGLSRGNRSVRPPAGAARATTSTRPDDGLAGHIGRRRSLAMFAAKGIGVSASINGSSAPSSSPGHWQVGPLGRTSVGPVTPAEAGACYTAITRNRFVGHNVLLGQPNMCNCRTASHDAWGWHPQNQW